ncbi:Protein Y57G11C.20 [Aphelenchoides avenae]|nr:Protein Y57G11C.20 [Aphelenchus avenae]
MNDQHVDIYLNDGKRIRAAVPRGAHQTPEVLERALQDGMVREMQRRLKSGAGSALEAARRPKRAAADTKNSTQLAAATRQLWSEWSEMARDPSHVVGTDPTKRITKKTNEKGETKLISVARPKLPSPFIYMLREQIQPNGTRRNYVDIVNTEEQARWLRMLRDAQDVIKHEEEHDSDIFSLTSYERFVNETMVPASSVAGVPTNKMRKQRNFRVEERPPLPPGYRYAFHTRTDTEDRKRVVRIEPDIAPEDAAGFETQLADSTRLPPPVTLQMDDDATVAKKARRRKPTTVVPSYGEDSAPPSGIVIAEDHGVVSAAAAASPRKEVVVAASPREPLTQAAPASEMRVVEQWLDVPPAPTRVEAVLSKTPFQRHGSPPPPPQTDGEEVAQRPADMDDADVLALVRATRFQYDKALNRFRLETDPERVRFVAVSPQLGFVLGYERGDKITHGEEALYPPDMRGGLTNLAIYCNIAENVILGDRMTSLLRVIAVSGRPGDILEKTYDTPIYSRISHKEVSDIEIEIRSMEGRLIPFEHGVVVVTLQFRKMLYY